MQCEFPICRFNATPGSTFCVGHGKHFNERKLKPAAKIPLKSVKRIAEEKLYKKIVKEMLAENPKCDMKILGVCTGLAEGLDHIQKRSPKNYLERKNLRRACNACNLAKEMHPELADKMGLTKSRFKK